MQNFKKHSEEYLIAIVMMIGVFAIVYLAQSGWVEAKKGEGITYEPYSGVTDHCVTDASGVTNRSLYDILQTIGTSKKATVKFKNDNESGATTAYKVVSASGGDFSAYSNVYFEFEPGAMLESGVTLSGVTLPMPANVIAQPNQQIMSGASLYFATGGQEIPVDWFGVNADGATSDRAAIQAAISSAVASNNDVVFYGERTFAIDSQITVASADHTRLIGRGGYPVLLWTGSTHDSTTGGADDDDSGAMIYFTGTDHSFAGIEHMSIDADEKANFCIYMSGTVNTHVQMSDLHMKHAQLDLIKFKYSGTAGLVNINLDRLTGYPTASFGGSDASCGRYCINFDNVTGVGNVHVSNSNFDSGVSGVIGITQTTAYGCDYLFTNLRGEANYATSDFIVVTYGGIGTIGALTLVGCKADVTGAGSINAIVHNKSANTARPLIHMIPFETQVAISYLYQEDNDATKSLAYGTRLNKNSITLNALANVGIMPSGTTEGLVRYPGLYYYNATDGSLNITTGATSYAYLPSGKKTVSAKTTDYVILTTDAGKVLTNTGSGATVTFSLPDAVTAVNGFEIEILNTYNQPIVVTAGASDKINNGSDAGSVYSGATRGQYATFIVSDSATGWIMKSGETPWKTYAW